MNNFNYRHRYAIIKDSMGKHVFYRLDINNMIRDCQGERLSGTKYHNAKVDWLMGRRPI